MKDSPSHLVPLPGMRYSVYTCTCTRMERERERERERGLGGGGGGGGRGRETQYRLSSHYLHLSSSGLCREVDHLRTHRRYQTCQYHKSVHTCTMINDIQWNLRTMDTVGTGLLSIVGRLSLSRRVLNVCYNQLGASSLSILRRLSTSQSIHYQISTVDIASLTRGW